MVFFASVRKRLPLFLIPLIALSGLSTPAWSQFEEYALKAVFMEKFTHFVEWPYDSTNAFKLCVIGENPFAGALQNLAALTHINDKPTTFANFNNPDSAPGCTMLFISNSKRHTLPRILDRLRNRPVLTIGDTAGFAREGGND